ncbi:GGDEF domain-containing protein [Steroidobacter sp.]|uniref:GGDEF domain-containing protein n=1 Tax=Steroidobacter sp. TaxID=1978227 RepID=UPI001A620D2D|nr:GGDEF domain-containing protein [Steroidobacter sp.]MBL8267413.1 diguanylate cyclase [Steroidobacter sp.]
MQPPTAFDLDLLTSHLSIGVVTALALTAIAALVRMLVLHNRLARRTRELETELAARRALEARNEQLSRLRLALETSNQRLKRLVAVDALTGIANRRQFDRVLEREVRRARREQLPLSLIFLDLDGFKQFNDRYGHTHGDDVLRKVAQTLDESFRRGGDLIARYGGEEFAVVLPGVDAHRAGLYAERLRRRIWRMAITNEAGSSNERITISGGVATLDPRSAEIAAATPDALLRAADQALYRAKCLGRNRIATAGANSASSPAPADAARPPVELAS